MEVRNQPLHDAHRHEDAIRRSYGMAQSAGGKDAGCDARYVWETGELFLATKDALETRSQVVLTPYVPDGVEARAAD